MENEESKNERDIEESQTSFISDGLEKKEELKVKNGQSDKKTQEKIIEIIEKNEEKLFFYVMRIIGDLKGLVVQLPEKGFLLVRSSQLPKMLNVIKALEKEEAVNMMKQVLKQSTKANLFRINDK